MLDPRRRTRSNIKERRDCSAALFDADGRMVAQAEHIPVHLGAMPEAVAAVIGARPGPGRRLHAQRPVPRRHAPARHHARLAGRRRRRDRRLRGHARAPLRRRRDAPGLDAGRTRREICQEGIVIPPVRLVRGGRARSTTCSTSCWRTSARPTSGAATCARSSPRNRLAAGAAGRAARAARRATSCVAAFGEVLAYAERRTREPRRRAARRALPAEDELEGDGVTDDDIPIARRGRRSTATSSRIDFAGHGGRRCARQRQLPARRDPLGLLLRAARAAARRRPGQRRRLRAARASRRRRARSSTPSARRPSSPATSRRQPAHRRHRAAPRWPQAVDAAGAGAGHDEQPRSSAARAGRTTRRSAAGRAPAPDGAGPTPASTSA